MNNKPVYTSVAQLKSKKSEKLLQGSLHTSRKNKSNKCASVEVADKSKEDFVRGDVKIVRVGEGQSNTSSKRFVKSRYMSHLHPPDSNPSYSGNKTISNISITSKKSNSLKRDTTIKQNCTLNPKAECSPKASRPLKQETSTPVAVDKSIFEPDVSAVLAPQNSGMETRSKARKGKRQQVKQPADDKITQTTLFVSYSQYLTNCLMAKEVAEDAAEKNGKILQELTNLTTDNVRHEQEVTDLEIEVKTMEEQENVERSLKLQKSVLEPIVDALDQTTANFNRLVANVEGVRHTLPLKKIVETDDKKLEDELVKMSISLGELNQFLHQPKSSENKSVEIIKGLSDKTEEQFKVLKEIEDTKQKLQSAKSENNRLKFQLECEEISKK